MKAAGGAAPGVRPEAELLLAAASVAGEASRSERLDRLVASGLDWAEVVRMARQNRLGALLFESLRRRGGVPAEALRPLERDFRATKFRNLRLLRESLGIVASLRERGVEAVPYKGPILAATLYDDLGLRQFKDVDFLVRPADIGPTRACLLERGYRALEDLDAEEEREHLAADCELHFERAGGEMLVEVHWQILPRRHGFAFDLEEYWGRLVSIRIANAEIRTFPPEDLLLVLAVHHGEKHNWRRLRWLGDVARLIAVRRDLDWEVALERARRVGKERTVLLGAYLAWIFLDAPIHETIRDRALADSGVVSQAGLVRARMFREDEGLPRFREWRRYLAADAVRIQDLGARPGTRGSLLRYFGAILRPDWTDRQALPLPKGLSLLYYLYRPARLLRRHRTGLLRRV